MALTDQSQVTQLNILQLTGATQTFGSETPVVDRISEVSNVIEAHGAVLPTAGTAGYTKGAIFRLTGGGTGIPCLYQNIGTNTSCNFQLMETSAASNAVVTYTSIATAGAAVYTAAQMVDAVIDRNGGAVNRTDTTDTATALIAAIPGAVVGSAFYLTLRNISATVGEKITLTGGVGVTFSGNPIVYANGATQFIGIVTNVATPAVTIYVTVDTDALQPALEAASSVNTIQFSTAATAAAPSFTSVGTDTNIGTTYAAKGTGIISLGQTTGGVNAFRAVNYIATETGANNAIAGALVDANGTAIPLQAGLRVVVKLAHTLQAGANTFNLNGGGALNIKSHINAANNIATPYAATGFIDLIYDGTQFLDMSL